MFNGGNDLDDISLANLMNAPAGFPISRRRSLAISSPERFWDRRCSMKVITGSLTFDCNKSIFIAKIGPAA
jgi:hypothetical protein